MFVTDECVAEVVEERLTANDSQVPADLPTACVTSDPSAYVERPSDMPRDAVDTDQQFDEDVVNDAVTENDQGTAAAATAEAEDSSNGPRSPRFAFIIASVVPVL